MTNSEQTIADKALAATETKAKAVEKKAEVKSVSKHKAGVYRSDKYMRIIKALTVQHHKDSTGQITKTYGTWAKDDNFITFNKGVEKRLTQEEVDLPAIQNLIDSKVIYRVGD